MEEIAFLKKRCKLRIGWECLSEWTFLSDEERLPLIWTFHALEKIQTEAPDFLVNTKQTQELELDEKFIPSLDIAIELAGYSSCQNYWQLFVFAKMFFLPWRKLCKLDLFMCVLSIQAFIVDRHGNLLQRWIHWHPYQPCQLVHLHQYPGTLVTWRPASPSGKYSTVAPQTRTLIAP